MTTANTNREIQEQIKALFARAEEAERTGNKIHAEHCREIAREIAGSR